MKRVKLKSLKYGLFETCDRYYVQLEIFCFIWKVVQSFVEKLLVKVEVANLTMLGSGSECVNRPEHVTVTLVGRSQYDAVTIHKVMDFDVDFDRLLYRTCVSRSTS